MMKSLIVLFADNISEYGFEKVFDGKSAFYKSLEWAQKINDSVGIDIFCFNQNKDLLQFQIDEFCEEKNYDKKSINLIQKENWSNELLFYELSQGAKKSECDYVIFSFAFCPFLNIDLTNKLISTHEKFISEYSFCDGYPVGVSPEILDKGICNILSELIKTNDDLKIQNVSQSSIFDLIKKDINSFEIETEISEIDWRLYRFNFSCDKKENFIACKSLNESSKNLSFQEKSDIQKLMMVASKSANVLKTIPGYFNIQITSDESSKNPYSPYEKISNGLKGNMDFEKFKSLIKNINEFNPMSVVSLSLWGDPVLHPDFFNFVNEVLNYPELSLLIETDGFEISNDVETQLEIISKKVNSLPKQKNGFEKIMWLVNLDAMTQVTYEKIHFGKKIESTVDCIKKLSNLFSKKVFPQFLRVLENEEELESFYRTFKDSASISEGNLIVQKYNDYCKKLPDYKPADLSPLERFPCWHLRRDFNILFNGNVVACKNLSFEKSFGNVFEQSLEDIWKKIDDLLVEHINENYCEDCKNCDEFYTYNF